MLREDRFGFAVLEHPVDCVGSMILLRAQRVVLGFEFERSLADETLAAVKTATSTAREAVRCHRLARLTREPARIKSAAAG